MKSFTLSIAEGFREKQYNCIYSKEASISSIEDFKNAVQFDHLPPALKNNYRDDTNFIQADCVIVDFDNTHSDNPEKWITPEKLAERLPNVAFAYSYSRNHMKEKEGRTPRPKWHAVFPLSEVIKDIDIFRQLQSDICKLITEADTGAKGATHFFYGVENPECGYHEGNLCLDEYLAAHAENIFTDSTGNNDKAKTDKAGKGEVIRELPSFKDKHMGEDSPYYGYFAFIANPQMLINEGGRHKFLRSVAVGALCNEDLASARQTYEKACSQCRPPHDKKDIARIWSDAKQYAEKQKAASTDNSKGRQKKYHLSQANIEKCLAYYNITIKFNVITKRSEISDLPAQAKGIPSAYATLSPYERAKQNEELLRLFLTPILKEYYTFSEGYLADSLRAITKLNCYNPVLDMLTATQWDGKNRLDTLCTALGIFSADDNNDTCSDEAIYYATFVRKWLHQSIAMALNDEGKRLPAFSLVLQGPQGAGKTNFFRRLAIRPEWFREGAFIDMRNKDTIIQATSAWICELGELDATLKREQSDLKSFLTTPMDRYRLPYGRTFDDIERRTSFCATVNPEQVHRDDTGSRRFVYVHINDIDKHFIFEVMTPEWVAQLWRQVYDLYYLRAPEGYYLDAEELAFLERHNAAFRDMLPAETELRDGVDWEDTGTLDWRKASDVMRMLKLERYGAKKVSKALQAIIKEYPHCKYSNTRDRSLFLMPKPQDLTKD